MNFTHRKAVSPLLATIILIALTVVGGIVVYQLFFATAGHISSTQSLVISQATIVGGSGSYISVTVKNQGSLAVSNFAVAVMQGSTVDITTGFSAGGTAAASVTLAPGQSAAFTSSVAPNTFQSGTQYTISVTGSANGNSVTAALAVTAQ